MSHQENSKKYSNLKLPHNRITEYTVINSMLTHEEARHQGITSLKPGYFFDLTTKNIYTKIVQLEKKNKSINLSTVSGGSEKRLSQLIYIQCEHPSPIDIKGHIEVLIDLYMSRETIKSCEYIKSLCYQPDISYNDIAQIVEENMTREIIGQKTSFVASADLISDALQRYEDAARGISQRKTIKWGAPWLDDVADGLQPGLVYIIAGRPSHGKTAFALQIMANIIKQDKKAGIVSLETPQKNLLDRMVAQEAEIDSMALRKGILPKSDYKKLSVALQTLKHNLYFYDNMTTDISRLCSECRALYKSQKLDVLFIDYLQLISAKKTESKRVEVGEISRQLKILANTLSIPIVVLSQLSRANVSNNRKPILSDLRETGNIEQDADFVLFVYRVGLCETPIDPCAAELILAKQRDGPIGSVKVNFKPHCTKFEFLNGSF
jgi:replicative DNA helicase